ncbi:serine/threonine protein kinase [Mycolicibacterium rhodesiae JS60]|nr:serine/threonine protein kinase [Mycolicibacterium rhodesiae JS60]
MSNDFGSDPWRAQDPGDGSGPRIVRPGRPPTTRDATAQPPATTLDGSLGRSATTRDGRPGTTRDAGPGTTRDPAPHGEPLRPHTTRDGGPSTTRDAAGFAGSGAVGASDFPLPHYLAAEYEIVDDTLGTGGEADVAVLRHRGDGTLKVVKVYRRGITLPQSFVDRLGTADPAHVLPVARTTYTGWTSPRFVEVMDYLRHGSLETLLEQSGGSAPDLAEAILVEMTDALDYIHSQLRIVHRDIKPANIMIRTCEPLDLVLADLGIAAEVAELRRSRRETTGGVKGTLVYQSPETLNMSDAGASRDWWALGMTICEVLTGQHPFKDRRGHTLRDENMIRHAITMGVIDMSMITDSRWNLLCRGLLAHNPDDRWCATQVRAWLAGDSPAVATHQPQPTGAAAVVRPYRFAGQRFTDPVALASHMVNNWDTAAAVFTSAEECATLRAWIREDVNDPTIDVNTLTSVGPGDQSQVDARIIEFTTHYRGGSKMVFRGEPLTAQALAVRYLHAGEQWENDALLTGLKPSVVAALAEAQFDEAAGPTRQSGEYYALARLSRFAQHVDSALEAARADIARAATEWVEGVDVGADVRDGLPIRVARARAIGRAALLSPPCLSDLRAQFRHLDTTSPAWLAALSARALTSTRSAQSHIDSTDADATEIAVKTLAPQITDLAAHYENACAAAHHAAEQRRHAAELRRQAEVRAQAEAAAQARADDRNGRDRVCMVVAAVLCITVLVPLGIGYFAMSKTPLLKPDPAVFDAGVRKWSDAFGAYYFAGVLPILLILAAALLWPPLQRRPLSVVVGCLAILGALISGSLATSKWTETEQARATKLRETPFPFADRYIDCASWNISAEDGAHQPELWQVHLGQTKGTSPDGCNQVSVYRGWQFVGLYNLPNGDVFTRDITVNHAGWTKPYQQTGSGDIWQTSNKTGERTPMNPLATNVDLPTKDGHVLDFNLDGAGADRYELR